MDLTKFYTDTLSGVTSGIPGALQQMTQSQRESIDMQRKALDEYRGALSASDGVDLPLLRASAAIGAPQRGGGLGGALASGMDAYAGALAAERDRNLTKAEKLAAIQQGLARLHQQGGALPWENIDRTLGAAGKIGEIDVLRAAAADRGVYDRMFGGAAGAGAGTASAGGLPPLPAPAMNGTTAAAPTAQAAPAPQGQKLPAELLQKYRQNQQIISVGTGSRDPRMQARVKMAQDENERMVPTGYVLHPSGVLVGVGDKDTEQAQRLAQARRAQEGLSSGDRTAIRDLEGEMRSLDNTLETLKEARTLAPQAHSGAFSGPILRGMLGESLPDMLVPDFIASPESAQATMRLNQILSSEAIEAMSKTLKGASTDKEMMAFIKILADPTASPKRKMDAINGIERKAKGQREDAQIMVDQIRGGTYYKPGGGRSAPAAQGSAAPADPLEAEMRRRGLIP